MPNEPKGHKPNVVIIMADQLRFDAIGEHTPNINKLMHESVKFDRAYCASPICVPARGAFFTGQYPNTTGSIINPWLKQESEHGMVDDVHSNLYELMEEEWDSWHTGKQHLFMDPKPEKSEHSKTHWLTLEGRYNAYLEKNGKRKPGGPAFKGLVPEMAYGKLTRKKSYSIPKTGRYEEGFEYFTDGFILNDSLQAIKNRDKQKPFLLNAMFVAPHPPFDIPEPFYSMVRDVELPDNVGEWYDNQSPLQMYNLTGAIGSKYNREEWEEIWKVYLGLVSLLDTCVGEIIEELKQEGLYEDTMIMFTSDHGEMLGSHGLWQKMCMYEESVRTPLAIKFPSGFEPKNRQIETPVSSIDILPTLCDFLNIEPPSNLSGMSLMPLIEEKKQPDELNKDIFIQFDGNGARGNFQRCIIRGDFKLIVDIFKDETFLELYNITDDRLETTNLAFNREAYETLIQSMILALRKHMTDTNDLLTIEEHVYDQFINDYLTFSK